MSKDFSIWDAKDCALIIIDYQEEMFRHIRSSDPITIERNMVSLIKAAKAFEIPIVLSTVGVEMKVNSPTLKSIADTASGITAIDRSTMNAWEDKNFHAAVKKTGKKRLVFCALYTEICLAYPVVSALQDGFEVCIVADAVAGESMEEHMTAIQRMVHAGAIPNTTMATICEWFRDWKSPLAAKAREVIKELVHEREVAGERIPVRMKQESAHPSSSH